MWPGSCGGGDCKQDLRLSIVGFRLVNKFSTYFRDEMRAIYTLWWSVCHVFAYFAYGRWENYFGSAGEKIILAGGKIILAGGEIILTEGEINLTGGEIQKKELEE